MELLKKIWEGWKKIAHKIGNFQARIILLVFYFIILAPFSLIIKRDGQIQSSRLLRSSGYSVLDGYARQAIFTASPFEGFPQAAGNTLIFTVTVYFYTL